MDIISIAQQARPKDIGQIELRRAQFTTLSSDASKIPSSFRKFASCPGASSVTPFAISIAMIPLDPLHRTPPRNARESVPCLHQHFAPSHEPLQSQPQSEFKNVKTLQALRFAPHASGGTLHPWLESRCNSRILCPSGSRSTAQLASD